MGGNFITPLLVFPSLNNSETVKAVTLAFCSIQEHFIRNILAKFGISNLPQSPDIGQNSDAGISDFQISGQSFIKENCHYSRMSNDIDMELGPVTKLDKRNTATSKKIDDDIITANCDVIVVFLVFGQFAAIPKPDSGRMVCKTYTFINSNLLLIVTFQPFIFYTKRYIF